MAQSRSQFPAIYVEGLRAITLRRYKAYKIVWDQIFTEGTSKKYQETVLAMAGTGRLEEFFSGQSPNMDRLTEGWITTFVNRHFGKMMSFELDAIEDDLYGVLGKDVAGAWGDGARMKQEQVTASIFGNGFTDRGPDGQPLFSAAHPLIYPRNGYYSYNNLGNVAFSATALEAAIIAYNQQITEEGELINDDPKTILFPTQLKFEVARVLNSTLTTVLSSSANAKNDVNVLKNIVDPLEWPRLPSATAWFLLGSKEQHGLKFFRRKALATRKWVDDRTENMVYACGERYSVGYTDARYTWGSLPV